jgi:glutathione S-transferase
MHRLPNSSYILIIDLSRHEVVQVNLKHKPDWLLERNPAGLVPVIEYRGHVIYESTICDEFLEDAFPAVSTTGPHALLPSCPFQRAEARLFMSDFDKVGVGIIHVFYHFRPR